jgi:hypothetical protein
LGELFFSGGILRPEICPVKDKRPSPLAPIVIALLLLGAVPSLYVAGYFGAGDREDSVTTIFLGKHRKSLSLHSTERVYPSVWMARLFYPAGKMESWVRGVDVQVAAFQDGSGR